MYPSNFDISTLKVNLDQGQITGVLAWGWVYGGGGMAIQGITTDSGSTASHNYKLGDNQIVANCIYQIDCTLY